MRLPAPAVLTSLALSLLSPSARADARADLVAMRGGERPVRTEMLGWDLAERAHFRTVVCSEGGSTTCSVTYERRGPGEPPGDTVVLSVAEVYCGDGSCPLSDPKVVARFLAADARARDMLPALTAAAPEKDASGVFGPVAGASTRVEVRVLDRSTPDRPSALAELVLRGRGGAVEVLGKLAEGYRVEKSALVGAYRSPSAARVALAVETETGVMCWSFQDLHTLAVDAARARAGLANTIGFRAYKRGSMTEARAAFTEATATDPTFALGWYNRAALESRDGDVAAAAVSLERAVALDASFQRRACKDRDFDALRGAGPAPLVCP